MKYAVAVCLLTRGGANAIVSGLVTEGFTVKPGLSGNRIFTGLEGMFGCQMCIVVENDATNAQKVATAVEKVANKESVPVLMTVVWGRDGTTDSIVWGATIKETPKGGPYRTTPECFK